MARAAEPAYLCAMSRLSPRALALIAAAPLAAAVCAPAAAETAPQPRAEAEAAPDWEAYPQPPAAREAGDAALAPTADLERFERNRSGPRVKLRGSSAEGSVGVTISPRLPLRR
ncbi:MAG: hypothetical protein AAFR16_07740 [Pseudomonadota bacterium]